MGGGGVRITADTSVLLRTVLQDDKEQAVAAQALLLRATVIAIPVPVFCEFALGVETRATVTKLMKSLERSRRYVRSEAVVTDLTAVEAGLTLLRAGGDFADGVIAHQGEAFGGNVFASFDRNAIALLKRNGAAAAEVSELTDAGR